MNKVSCFLSSLDANEEMYGTAPRVDVWMLLEYRGNWPKDAVKNCGIPDISRNHLNHYLKTIPNSRLQLIKKYSNSYESLMFYIAVSEETGPRLYGIELENYDNLLSLDIAAIIRGNEYLLNKDLFIICTNGEHDGCCGKLGMPLYREISESMYGPDTWETTHLGGHRFASTIVCLPHGIYYGRVRDLETASQLFREYGKGAMNTRYYRGRSYYDKDVQAAEYYLRAETGVSSLGAYRVANIERDGNHATVEFSCPRYGKSYRVELTEYKKSLKLLKSCSDQKPSHVSRFSLESFTLV